MNKYADLTHEEFIKRNGFIPPSSLSEQPSRAKRYMPASNANVPSAVDWRKEGFVTPVKDQGTCGDCWAFSATASIEGQYKKKTGQLVSFSEQNFLDCTKSGNFVDKYGRVVPIVNATVNNFFYSAFGCGGGNFDAAFQYFKYNGQSLAKDYPYVGKVFALLIF